MKTLASFIIVGIIYCAMQYSSLYYKEVREKNRIALSFAASTDSLRHYKAKNGQLLAQSNIMQLRYDELKNTYPQIIEEIKNLRINPGKVTNYSETVIRQDKEFITHLRDFVIHDTIRARVFDYRDNFYTIKGIAVGDSQRVSITSIDSIIQVVYWGERIHPWLWILSRRKLQQAIASTNPNNIIQYNHTVQIVK